MDRNETLTVAAQKLSEALAAQREVALIIAITPPRDRTAYVERAKTAAHEVGVAKAVYRAAFKAYTDPFGVRTFA